jgi:methionine synthase II (cobalamin-independent)
VTRPWPPGSATGVGSMPGTDIAEALRLALGELPDLPYLPELPDRGAGADLIGRGATFLAELPVEIQPSGWRLTAHPGRDLRRARDFLARDLDELERHAGAHAGVLKVQLVGPWTLAAGVELPSGHRVVSDHGAVRDLAAALGEGLRAHLADLAQRLPAASVVVQLDEPSIPAVLAAAVPTPSGFGTVRSVEPGVVAQRLRDVLDVVPSGARVVHCCAAGAPVALLRAAGADAVSLDASLLGDRDIDALGEAVDAGTSLWLGVVPGVDAEISLDPVLDRILRMWRAFGFPDEQLAESVVPTPACGLAGASPSYVRRALAVLRDVGSALRDKS